MGKQIEAVNNRVSFGEQAVTHRPKMRSSVIARFKEMNPTVISFINGLIQNVSSSTEEDREVRASQGILDQALKGFPSGEVLNICAFLTEATTGITGFSERYDWSEMSDEEKVDFFDLEVSDFDKISYLIAIYVKFFMR